MIVGASLDETVPVPCHVAADPLDVSFDWNFSNSGERFEVTSGQFNLLQDFHSSSSVASDSGMGGGMAPLYDAMDENSGKSGWREEGICHCSQSMDRPTMKQHF